MKNTNTQEELLIERFDSEAHYQHIKGVFEGMAKNATEEFITELLGSGVLTRDIKRSDLEETLYSQERLDEVNRDVLHYLETFIIDYEQMKKEDPRDTYRFEFTAEGELNGKIVSLESSSYIKGTSKEDALNNLLEELHNFFLENHPNSNFTFKDVREIKNDDPEFYKTEL